MASRGRAENPFQYRYFHGRISREEAESKLKGQGCSNGLYLLREKLNKTGSYVLSLCFNHNVFHYELEAHKNGRIAIEDGKEFIGPIELIKHHQDHLDGLLTKLTQPCNLPEGQVALTYEGMSQEQLLQTINQAANDLGVADLSGHQLERAVMSTIHIQKPWFHGSITREEATERIEKEGQRDGTYLVREREGGSFAIGISYRKTIYHYKVDKDDRTGKYSIQDGRKFDTLYQMIDHYSKSRDGLLYELTIPVVSDRYKNSQKPNPPPSPTKKRSSLPPTNPRPTPSAPPPVPPPLSGARIRNPSDSDSGIFIGSVKDQTWDDEPDQEPPALPLRPLPPPPAAKQSEKEEIYGSSVSNTEKIYDSVAKRKTTVTLNYNCLTLSTQLGKGNFGSVVKGIYRMDRDNIPVAVKTLKEEERIPNKKPEIMKEAELMARLDHPYIVRMIGMCQGQGNVMMLVLELAELGPLNKYLQKNPTMRIRNILEILLQVAMGMQYLESQQFVHRDLAARNVLLVTETYAKISDFGMSKALGLESQYYVAETAGKWPLKWYAPECIYRFKFSSKGDVWSFGVTAWEGMTFGKRPYAKMKGQQILDELESGKRLDKPEKCPDEVYSVMLECWEYDYKSRPDFKAVVTKMKQVLTKVKKGEIRLVQ